MPVINQIHKHRSIRKYKPDPVPEELLNEILEAGIRTSSSGNMQTYSIIVTRDRHLREKLLDPHLQQTMVVEAPVLITFCADFHRMRRWLKINNAPDNFDNYFSFMVAAIDAILVSQTVALAAESNGLGICFLGSTLANADQIGSILNLPDNVIPVAGFTLGYPAENPELRDRLPASGLIHNEKYQSYSDEDIRKIYKEREVKGWQRYMQSKRLKELAEENNVENLAQLYTIVKYTKSSHQEHSRNLLDYLFHQNFMNNHL
ncbi:MAG: nitroreductase family protein [Anaerolineales bacterium]|nr:nitroreductase family protein [Anaerolineales bacterium]